MAQAKPNLTQQEFWTLVKPIKLQIIRCWGDRDRWEPQAHALLVQPIYPADSEGFIHVFVLGYCEADTKDHYAHLTLLAGLHETDSIQMRVKATNVLNKQMMEKEQKNDRAATVNK